MKWFGDRERQRTYPDRLRRRAIQTSSATRGKTDRRFVRLIVEADPVPLKETQMKMVIGPAAALFLVGLAPVVLAEPPAKERGKEVAALEQKIHGAWKGQTG